MSDVVLGLLAIVVGLFLCVSGQWALRILLAVWGAFVGFALGAGVVSAIGGDEFLTTTLGWACGLITAIVFASLAFLYYAVGVVLSMAAMGFVLGGTLASALGASQNWLITVVGAVVGGALAALAVIADLPQLLLIVVSSLTGASATIGGLMLLTGAIDTDQLVDADATAADHPVWYAGLVVVAVAGMIIQLRQLNGLRSTVRQSW